MKNRLLLIMTFCFCSTAFSQTFSGGLQTGTSLWFTKTYKDQQLHFTKGQNMTWENGFFLRYDAKKRFAMEFSFNHYYYHNDRSENLTDPNVNDDWQTDYVYDEYVNNYELEMNFQYDVLCNHLKSCSFFKHLEANIGLALIPTLSYTRFDHVFEGGDIEFIPLTHRSGNYKSFNVYTALSQTLKYNISSKIYISAKGNFSIDPFTVFSRYNNDEFGRLARVSFQIGAGYNF